MENYGIRFQKWDLEGNLLSNQTWEAPNKDIYIGDLWGDGVAVYVCGTIKYQEYSELLKWDLNGNKRRFYKK